MAGSVFGRGMSTEADATEATRAALSDAIVGIEGQPTLAIALCGPNYEIEAVQETLQTDLEAVPVIGSTTAGEFTDQGVCEEGVVVALVAADSMEVATACGDGVSEDVFGAVNSAVEQLPDSDQMPGSHTAAITFHNGLAGRGEEITMVTSQLLGHIPLVGGSAGDNLAMEETTVFTEDSISADGVVIGLVSSERPFSFAVSHGHAPLSESYEVTHARENVVEELGDEPAYEVWKREITEAAEERYDIDVDSVSPDDEEFAELLNQFELGIETRDGYKIRWPALTDSTDGPLKFATGVPEQSVVRIMHSPEDGQIESARDAAQESLRQFEGEDVAGALVFDCVCRGLILDDEFDKAIDGIAEEIDAPLAGFETYGEVYMPPEAASGYHNTTTAIFLLPE